MRLTYIEHAESYCYIGLVYKWTTCPIVDATSLTSIKEVLIEFLVPEHGRDLVEVKFKVGLACIHVCC